MSAVCFYLKKPSKRRNARSKESLIYLQYRHKETFVYCFGQTISPDKWSATKHRAKLNSERCIGRKEHLNELLNSITDVVENAVKDGITGKQALKQVLDKHLRLEEHEHGEENGFYNLIGKFLSGEIKVDGRDKQKTTIRSYKTTVRHLREFEFIKRVELNFNSMTQDFYNQYLTFLRTRSNYKHKIELLRKDGERRSEIIDLGNNAIGKDIKNIKVFMNEGLDQDLTDNRAFTKKKIKVFNEDSESVYLNVKEILKLYRHDFSDNKRLEEVRDLFVFACWVGLRYSDLVNIKKENLIVDNEKQYLRIKTIKTGEEVIIPTNIKIIEEVFNKYQDRPNSLPKFISNVKYNLYIKEACRAAGLTETNRLSQHPEIMLCDAVSSHTARRSFATNLYLMPNVAMIDIMKVTGHKSETMFLKYIKVNKLEAAKRLNEHYEKNASTFSLASTG